MDCPACRTPLIVLEFESIEIDYCPTCKGSWYDAGELELILGHDEALADGGFAAGKRGKRRCPHCLGKMRTGPLPGTDVEVDLCASHGFWLDKGELQRIVRSRGGTADARTLGEFCKNFFGNAVDYSNEDEEKK